MCHFDYTAVVVSGKVGIPLTDLTTPIEWMVSGAILIDRPKSVPQLLCNRTQQCSKIFKLNINAIGSFLVTQYFRVKHFCNIIFFGEDTYSNFS